MAFDAHTTAAPAVLPFPTDRKRRYPTAYLGNGVAPPANVVRLERPEPEPLPITRTPTTAALEALAFAMDGKTYTRWTCHLASQARAGDPFAYVALEIITGRGR